MRALIIAAALVCALTRAGRADDATDRREAEKHFRIGEKAYQAQNFAAAAEHFEEAYKILPIPDLAFSAAQAYRRQYRVDREIKNAVRAAELYRTYLDSVKTGGRVGDAADGLDSMEREVAKRGGSGAKPGVVAVVERTTIVINPELGSERKGEAMFEIAEPSDAAPPTLIVMLDGKPVAPYARLDVEPGVHKIHVEADGYLPLDATERATPGGSATANLVLQPRPAKVTIETERGAKIRVDGRAVGGGPRAELELAAGRHMISIVRSGRESIARELTVTRGETRTLREPLEKTARRKAVPWVIGAAGALAVISGTTMIAALVEDRRAADLRDSFATTGDKSSVDAAEYRRLVDNRDQAVIGAWVSGGAAVLVGATALVLYAFDSPGDAEVRIAPAVTPTGAGVSLGGRF